MVAVIPQQLWDEPLIRLHQESKAPVVDVYETEPLEDILAWVSDGGNVGASALGDLVIIDIDSDRLQYTVEEVVGFPETFAVMTGSWGTHEYYRCPGWETCRQLTDDGDDLGSIRSDGWQAAIPPSTHPDTGRKYSVLNSSSIQQVEPALFDELLDALDLDGDQDAGGGGGGGERTKELPGVPDEYPSESASWPEMQAWLDENGLPDRLDRLSDDQSGDEFVVAKCLAEAGFAVDAIFAALDRRPSSAKWHRRDHRYRERTVQNAIQAAREDEYVDW